MPWYDADEEEPPLKKQKCPLNDGVRVIVEQQLRAVYGAATPEQCVTYFGHQFLQQFEVICVLGEPGGYGAVFKCRRRTDNVLFAVKVISILNQRNKGDERLTQLETEIAAMHRVRCEQT